MPLTILGDFEELFGVKEDPDEDETGQWDAVLTCFFIDTVSCGAFRDLAAEFRTSGQKHCQLPSNYPSHSRPGRDMDQLWTSVMAL